jgi:hypothetical protein
VREKEKIMSKAVPHYTPEWLDAYNKRLGKVAPKPPKTPPVARPESSPTLVPYSATESVAAPFRVAGDVKQSKTEQKYNREVLNGQGRFEAVCLYLPGGGRYTPDFMTIDDGVITFHEVKGSYRLGSQGRAYTAFHEAAAYFPMWRFVWAHWTGNKWDCKTLSEIRE